MKELQRDPIPVYTFTPHKKGDTVYQKQFSVTINDEPPLVAITDVRIELVRENKVWYRYSTELGNIILNPPGLFTMTQHILDIPVGYYDYDAQIIYANGVKKTYFRGVWRIYEDYTK